MAASNSSFADKKLRQLPGLLITALMFFANITLAEEIFLSINVKKPMALTSDKFLSYTLDPTDVLGGQILTENPIKSVNMAKALSPAYVRIGGPRSNSYTFATPHHLRMEEDPSYTITEADWVDVHRWAKNAGLEILACIAPNHFEIRGRDSVWDSRNALDLISFTDHMGFNTSWQLGYECQTRCDAAGIGIGKAVMQLRSILDAFPRYAKSVVVGPDVVAYRTRQQQQYLQDFLDVAGNALSAITWHPNFAGITVDPEGVLMHRDNLAIDKDILFRVMGRSMMKKPLWLAESKVEGFKNQFLGALVWTRRLGNAARLGAQVIMRQPVGSNLLKPTPDYWVSVLHKLLVGREVLDTKISNGNRSHVHFYSQCTRPTSKYEKGSLTIFGINLTPSKVLVNVKGLKIKTIHKYILMPGFDRENRMFSETVLLNNGPLKLLNDEELPEIKPAVSRRGRTVLKLPSGGIGFWVLPGLKIKPCGGLEEDNADRTMSKKQSMRLGNSALDGAIIEVDVDRANVNDGNVSTEEGRPSLKSNKNRKRRKHRNSEENDSERGYRRNEAKMDLDKLEKMLRRRDSYGDKKSSAKTQRAYFGFDDKDLGEPSANLDIDGVASEETVKKLFEYKKRLENYDSRMENFESKSRGKVTDASDGDAMIDSEKVMEAIQFISKMQNAMDKWRMPNDEISIVTRDGTNVAHVSNDTSTDLASDNRSNTKEVLFDELLKTAKIKRSDVPTKIEDQLEAIYQIPIDKENAKSQGSEVESEEINPIRDDEEAPSMTEEFFSRARRETGKKFGIDPLGLRKEGMFRRLNRYNEERRIDRKKTRKDKEVQEDGHVVFDRESHMDSEENNFYGFHEREPTQDFPREDVHLVVEGSMEATLPKSAHAKDDDKVEETKHTTRNSRKKDSPKMKSDTNDDSLIVDKEIKCFENVRMVAAPALQKDPEVHAELWEAETIGEKVAGSSNPRIDDMTTVKKIVHERHREVHEDNRAKKIAIEKIIGYYGNGEAQTDKMAEYESSDSIENAMSTSGGTATINDEQTLRIDQAAYPSSLVAKKEPVIDWPSEEYGRFADSDYIGKSTVSSAEEQAFGNYDIRPKMTREKRTKRSSIDVLGNVPDRETIFEGASNLKDCGYRVPRDLDHVVGVESVTPRTYEKGRRLNKTAKRGKLEEVKERRKSRKLNTRVALKPVTNLNGKHKHTLRSKRDAKSSNEKIVESTTQEAESRYDEMNAEHSTMKEKTGFQKLEDPSNYDESVVSEKFGNSSNDLENLQLSTEKGIDSNDLILREEIMNVTLETNQIGKTNLVKRHGQETLNKTSVKQSDLMESLVDTPNVEDFIAKDSLPSETTKTHSPKFFRNRKSRKERTKKFNAGVQIEEANTLENETLSLIQAHNTSAPKDNTSLFDPHPVVESLKNEDSPSAIASDFSENGTTTLDKGIADNPPTLTKNNEYQKRELPISNTRSKTTEDENMTSTPFKNDTTLTKKLLKRPKKAPKTRDPVKLRGIHLPSGSSSFSTANKNGNLTRKKKSKLIGQLEKLQEKLRQKRDELMENDREKKSDEGTNLPRHGAFDMEINEKELRDLIDTEKLEYIKHNKPVNYEATKKSSDQKDAGQPRQKYVPAMIGFVRPIHMIRERRVKPRPRTVGAITDPELLDYAKPEIGTSVGTSQGGLKGDEADHRIKRRDGHSHYSTFESFESPEYYEQTLSYDEESGEEIPGKTENSMELDKEMTESSSACDGQEFTDSYDENNELQHGDDSFDEANSKFPDSHEEEVEDINVSGDSLESFRNTENDNCICMKETSGETSAEYSDELSELVKEKCYCLRSPIDGSRVDDKEEHASEKRDLVYSDYDDSNYKSQNYDKFAEAEDSMEAAEDQASELLHSGKTFPGNVARNTRKKKGKQTPHNKLPVVSFMRGNSNQKKLSIMDYIDYDEALNSRDYELMMLIPVRKNRKRSRQRRSVNAERSSKNLLTNDVSSENLPEYNDRQTVGEQRTKETISDDDTSIGGTNAIDLDQAALKAFWNDLEGGDHSSVESATIAKVEELKTPMTANEKVLHDNDVIEVVPPKAKIIANDSKNVLDEGLPDLLGKAIPKIEETLAGGLGKARRISESFEKFIDDFDDKFDQEQLQNDSTTSANITENHFPVSSNIFHSVSTNVKKFFDFLSEFVHVFRFN